MILHKLPEQEVPWVMGEPESQIEYCLSYEAATVNMCLSTLFTFPSLGA